MSALRESAPVLGIYALYMRDEGLSPGHFATALVLWSVAGFVLEVPSGALADRVDRRRLLLVSGVLYVGVFVTWAAWPTMGGFVLGFVLWGASSALESGTFEALLHDELTARGAADGYGRVRSRSRAAATVALGLAIAAGGPLHAVGGYRLVLAVSIVTAAAFAASVLLLPRAAPVEEVEEPGGYLQTLRDGVGEALGRPLLRRILLSYMAVIVVVGVDEYVPNLLSDNGIGTTAVALLVAVMVGADAVGALLADRLAHTANAATAAAVPVAGAVLIGAGALLGPVLTAFGVIVGYGLVASHMLAMDIRLQAAIEGSARATVTSVMGVANETASITSFALFGFAAAGGDWSRGIGVVALAAALPVGLTAWRAARR